MSVTVRLIAPHSGSKDHLAMAGGTLTADKRVDGDAPLAVWHHVFPVAEIDTIDIAASAAHPPTAELRELFSGIHSIEHALASPLAGDLRARLAERAGGEAVGARLVDMSPYVPGLGDEPRPARLTIGFRSTFVTDDRNAPPPRDELIAAYRAALDVIVERFERGGEVPFATPESCGQYDMHSAAAALDLIAAAESEARVAGSEARVAESRVELGARQLYVCDLRLVKPRLPEAFGQRVLDPLAGHLISQAVEPAGMIAGNFGCSTGEYLLVPNPDGLDVDAALGRAHAAVAATLRDLAAYAGVDPLRAATASDARFCLDHMARSSPGALAGLT